jgi:hypothetical protein
MIDLFQRLHENYISRVEKEKEKLRKEKWSVDKMEGYVQSYEEHGLYTLRSLFGLEPAIIEACIEEAGYRKVRE